MSATAERTLGGSILVVGPEMLVQAVRGGCNGRPIDRVDDVLPALERVAEAGYAAVFVWAASLPSRSDAAVAALRQLLDPAARLLLVARPEEEPLARGLLAPEVDDYLIWPLRPHDVMAALQQGSADETPGRVEASPGLLGLLGPLLETAGSDPAAALDRAAALVAGQMHARGCTIEAGQSLSICGEAIGEPVLEAAIDLGAAGKGRLALGPHRSGAYSPADAAMLQEWADIVGTAYRLGAEAAVWRHKALTDDLTGLLNRRGLMQRLPEILETSRRQRNPVTVLMFDIDNFKHYNDQYGHAAGDEILREAGGLFGRHVRKHDIVARYGGDEFVVVFWEADEPRKAGSKPPRDVLAVLTRFKQSLESHDFTRLGPEARGRLTISGGLITFPWDAFTAEELIARADEALLLAKRQGKNRIWLVGQGAQ